MVEWQQVQEYLTGGRMDSMRVRQKIIKEISSTLGKVKHIDRLAAEIISSHRIFVAGAGRTKLMLEAFAQRLSHLGFNVHIAGEVLQPPARKKDLLIVASGSGESILPLAVAKRAKEIGMKVVLITARRNSGISKFSDFTIYIPAPVKTDAFKDKKSLQPLGSLFEQTLLILGDIVTVLIQGKKGGSGERLSKYHANLE